jgi:hypothetical protein
MEFSNISPSLSGFFIKHIKENLMMRKEKWHVSRKISLLLIFLSTIFIFSTPSIADEITIVADQWSPYCAVPDSEKPG